MLYNKYTSISVNVSVVFIYKSLYIPWIQKYVFDVTISHF